MRRRLGAVLLALVVTATGCSGDTDEPTGATTPGDRVTVMPITPSDASMNEYVDALADGLVDQEAPMDAQQARCVSAGLLDVVGLERARSLGEPNQFVERTRGLDFSAVGITRKEASAAYDQFEVCDVDVRRATVADVSQGMSKRQQRCLARVVTGDRVREYYVTLMVQGPATAEAEADEPDQDERDRGEGTKKGKTGRKNKGDTGENKKGDRQKSERDGGADQGGSRDGRPRDPGDSPLMRAMVKCVK